MPEEIKTQHASYDWMDRVFSSFRDKLLRAQECERFGSIGVTVSMRNGVPSNVEFAECCTEPSLIKR